MRTIEANRVEIVEDKLVIGPVARGVFVEVDLRIVMEAVLPRLKKYLEQDEEEESGGD